MQSIVWASDNDFRSVFGTDLAALHDNADYSNWLPNIDFSVALNDAMKVRASVSQTIARPLYNTMYQTTTLGAPWTLTVLGGVPRASSGNACLKPLESFNLDMSFEWYYAESSYASVGFFRRRSTTSSVPRSRPALFDLQDPTSGLDGTLSGDAAAALEAGGFAVNEENMFTMAAVLQQSDGLSGWCG